MTIYRKIWAEHFGPIPKDENGRTYEIHHIDGNRNNNDISNLLCVSIDEHYKIHYEQGDYGACFSMCKRMQKSPEEISEISRKTQLKRIEDGTHHWVQPEYSDISRKENLKRIENGTHHFLSEEWKIKNVELRKKEIAEGTHNWAKPGWSEQNRQNQLKRIEDGTHHLMDLDFHQKLLQEGKHGCQSESFKEGAKRYRDEALSTGTHVSVLNHICPHCGKEGKGFVMFRHHFENCKQKSLPDDRRLFPYIPQKP